MPGCQRPQGAAGHRAQGEGRHHRLQGGRDRALQGHEARLSTKLVGESLEQHCEVEFNKIRATAFPRAYFEKDNDQSGGSKGDFIFRECDEEGNEIVSIMFEMKNEADDSTHRKTNESHFKKLDADRRKKGCEYAVLVSLLEPDNELYAAGITDVSYRFEKMYVIRPQFFIPLITLLRNAALSSMDGPPRAGARAPADIDARTRGPAGRLQGQVRPQLPARQRALREGHRRDRQVHRPFAEDQGAPAGKRT